MRSRQAPEAGALLLVAGCVLTFTVLYGGAAWLGDGFSTRYRLYFEWERNIPLVPAAAFVYLSVFLTYLPVLRELPSARALKPVAWTLLAEQLIAVLCFLLLPLEDGFPTAPPPAGLSGAVWRFAGQLAMRHNYLPSLHVALATTAALVVGRAQGRPNGWMLGWAGAIAVSTLLVHQHHVADVLAGGLLAWGAVVLIYDRLTLSAPSSNEQTDEQAHQHGTEGGHLGIPFGQVE